MGVSTPASDYAPHAHMHGRCVVSHNERMRCADYRNGNLIICGKHNDHSSRGTASPAPFESLVKVCKRACQDREFVSRILRKLLAEHSRELAAQRVCNSTPSVSVKHTKHRGSVVE